MGFLITLFGRREKSSSSVAKDRLLEVLIHDRIKLPPATMELIRMEILAVLSKYIEVDREHMEVSITREDGAAHLTANIPIRREAVNMKQPDDAVESDNIGAPSTAAASNTTSTAGAPPTAKPAGSGSNPTPQSLGPQGRRR